MSRYELDLDGGNSRLKYRLRGSTSLIGYTSEAEADALFASILSQYGVPDVIRFGAVWGSDRIARLKFQLEVLQAPLLEAVVVQGLAGLSVSYNDVSRFGVDRWLAMLAAREQCPEAPLLVIDCGTAVTLDYLLSDGVHQGGYIVPGLHLATTALNQKTAQVGEAPLGAGCIGFGCDTQSAVAHGVQLQLCALIEQSLNLYCVAGTRLLLTGGDASIIAAGLQKQFGRKVNVLPELVLDGLQVALPRV